jgi:hypothetical protein
VDEGRARKHALLERVMRVAIAAVAVACLLPVVAFLLTGAFARDSAAAAPRALGVRTFQARAALPTRPPRRRVCRPRRQRTAGRVAGERAGRAAAARPSA